MENLPHLRRGFPHLGLDAHWYAHYRLTSDLRLPTPDFYFNGRFHCWHWLPIGGSGASRAFAASVENKLHDDRVCAGHERVASGMGNGVGVVAAGARDRLVVCFLWSR